MTKFELMKFIIDVHNRLLSISVCGESAILMADVIKDLRAVLIEMQKVANLEKDCDEDEQQRGDSSG